MFTFTLRPTMSELLADLTGYEVNGFALVLILWIFLAIIIAGSVACIQVLNEAVKAKQTGNIIFMILVEIAVAMFEVLFLYRELVDAMTPWLAQQGIQLGVFGTIGLAFFGWVGVRGMTWFLFGRFGAPALIGLLGRQAFAVEGSASHATAPLPDYWKGPISALKAEREWFRKEARELFELVSLPVLQVVAAGLNFLFVVFTGRGHFTLPFKSIDDVSASTSGRRRAFIPSRISTAKPRRRSRTTFGTGSRRRIRSPISTRSSSARRCTSSARTSCLRRSTSCYSPTAYPTSPARGECRPRSATPRSTRARSRTCRAMSPSDCCTRSRRRRRTGRHSCPATA